MLKKLKQASVRCGMSLFSVAACGLDEENLIIARLYVVECMCLCGKFVSA